MYVDNGTTKLPVSAEILVRNQGLAIGILKEPMAKNPGSYVLYNTTMDS